MRRLIGGVALLVLAATAAACGHTVGAGPALDVSWAPDSGQLSDLYTARLSPHSHPSGFISFRVVHDGAVKTLARCSFHALANPGSVRIRAAAHSILVAWTIPGGSGARSARLMVPKGLQSGGGSSWSGGTFEPRKPNWTWTVWEEEYAPSWPGDEYSGMTIGDFSGLVYDSVHNPHRTAYCVVIKVDPQ